MYNQYSPQASAPLEQTCKKRDIEQYTSAYTNQTFSFEETMVQFRRKKVLEVLENYKPKTVLEIGCGLTSISAHYNEFEKFVIVEPSLQFATKVKHDLAQNTKIILINDFIENHIEHLREESFDCIILSALLHEVSNPKDFLYSITRLCSSHTLLHINVPNAHSFHLLWAYESGLLESLGNLTKTAKTLQQHSVFDMQGLQELARSCDLEIKESGSYFIKPFNHAKMALLCNADKQDVLQKEAVISSSLLSGLDKMIKYMPDLGAEIFINCMRAKQ